MFSPRDRRLGRPDDRAAGRRGSARGRRLAPALLIGIVAVSARAQATSLDDPNIGGIGFSGPTTGDLGAIYWNPAALGLMRGLQVTVGGTGEYAATTVRRASIDPATGLPGAGMSFSAARSRSFTQPLTWPPGPGAFAGLAYDVGGDRFSLGFATFMPYSERTSYGSVTDPTNPTRYHRIAADLRNLALVPALAIRLSGDLRLGFAPGFLFSTGHLSFDEPTCPAGASTPCPAGENADGDARYDIASSSGLSSAKFAFTLGGGLYYRRRAWEFGLAFSSRPFGGDGPSPAGISGVDTLVTRPARDGGTSLTCMNGRADGRGCVFANVSYNLPFVITAGATWHPVAGGELSAIARVLSFPAGDVLDIRVIGASLEVSGLPQHIVLYRGYGTVYDLRLRYAQWLGEGIRIGGGLRLESSALPSDAVSPAAVDGLKMQPTVMILVRPTKRISITAGYGFTYMFDVTANNSVFAPGAAAGCQAAGGDLTAGDCMTRLAGKARPTAAGTYGNFRHDFSLSVTTRFF
jgi:hypothetical protein